jgi:hypothetical protein
MNERVRKADKEVHACLNYGGIVHDATQPCHDLRMIYEQGDLVDEIAHMRRFAAALNELASSLEDQAQVTR